MKTRLQNDLLVINILTSLLFVIIAVLPSNFLRIVFSLPVILFCPEVVVDGVQQSELAPVVV